MELVTFIRDILELSQTFQDTLVSWTAQDRPKYRPKYPGCPGYCQVSWTVKDRPICRIPGYSLVSWTIQDIPLCCGYSRIFPSILDKPGYFQVSLASQDIPKCLDNPGYLQVSLLSQNIPKYPGQPRIFPSILDISGYSQVSWST